uniref:Virion-packaging protein U64 n=1 Tax=Lygus hesperus TaxID=30085 RepID=A0A0A9YMC0_LYGHE
MTQLVAITFFLLVGFWNCLAMPSVESGCQNVNDAVDKDIESYNIDTIKYHEGTCDVADFSQDFQMTLLWFTLPFKTNFYATNGLLTLGNLSRSDDATQCSNSSSQTLQGGFEYDEVRVSYDMTAKFYHWQMDGKFSCSFQQPSVKFLYTKSSSAVLGCQISSFDLNSSGKRECKVTSDSNSWSAWVVGKAAHYALLSKQPTPDSMVSSFLQASYSIIETNFFKYWC